MPSLSLRKWLQSAWYCAVPPWVWGSFLLGRTISSLLCLVFFLCCLCNVENHHQNDGLGTKFRFRELIVGLDFLLKDQSCYLTGKREFQKNTLPVWCGLADNFEALSRFLCLIKENIKPEFWYLCSFTGLLQKLEICSPTIFYYVYVACCLALEKHVWQIIRDQ